jgi:hypothetical protein
VAPPVVADVETVAERLILASGADGADQPDATAVESRRRRTHWFQAMPFGAASAQAEGGHSVASFGTAPGGRRSPNPSRQWDDERRQCSRELPASTALREWSEGTSAQSGHPKATHLFLACSSYSSRGQ